MKREEKVTVRTPDEAMACYARGDERAFAEIYAAVVPYLTRYYERRLWDKGSVPDLVQETLLRVHRARASFAPGSTVFPWVLTIARHLLIDMHRANRHEELAGPDELDRFTVSPTSRALPNGEELLVAKEMARSMEHALAGVSETQRAALRLVKAEGLSIAAAAVALRTTKVGVRLRTHRALRALRAHLEVESREPAVGRGERRGDLRQPRSSSARRGSLG